MKPIIDLDAQTYQPHWIHGDDRIWAETNCYVDILVELIHALGYDPVACLAFTVAADFEGDQWTFFKPPPGDLLALYGMDIQELNPWKGGLPVHVAEQVARGRPVLVEVDSYHLPDTRGTAYQQAHVKTTIAVNQIDCDGQTLGYFHGQGYYELAGADYRALWHLDAASDPARLPPYIEFVRLRGDARHADPDHQARLASQMLATQVVLMPEVNPFQAFTTRFQQDLDALKGDLEAFHQYSFATMRQFGACFELSAAFLRWLDTRSDGALEPAAAQLAAIAESAKVLQFQLARAVARGKPLDTALLGDMARAWDTAAAALRSWAHPERAQPVAL